MDPDGILFRECVRRRQPDTICFHLDVESIKATQMNELNRDRPIPSKLTGARGGARAEKIYRLHAIELILTLHPKAE